MVEKHHGRRRDGFGTWYGPGWIKTLFSKIKPARHPPPPSCLNGMDRLQASRASNYIMVKTRFCVGVAKQAIIDL